MQDRECEAGYTIYASMPCARCGAMPSDHCRRAFESRQPAKPSIWAIDYGPSDGIEIFDNRDEAMRNANGRPVIAYAVVEEIKQ